MARRGSTPGFTPRSGSAPGLESLADAATFRLSEAEAAAAASDYQSQFGPWTSQEDEKLRRLVAQYGPRWKAISTELGSKSDSQCARRWELLNKAVKRYDWTVEEDRALVQAHRELGNKWKVIADRVGGRTADATRNRWVALLGKYPNLKNDHVYEEKMSSRSRHNRGESQSPHSQRSHSETPQLTPLSMVMRRRELDIDLNAPPPPDNGQQDGDFHVHNGHPRRGSPEHEGGDSFGEDGMPRRKIQTRFSKRKEAATVKLEDEASHVAVDPPKPVMQVFVPPPDDSDAVAHDDGLAPMAVGEDDSPPPPAYPGSMEHVWQSLQQEEGAEAREAANGPQDRRVDGLSNGTHPAVPPREKCWIHRASVPALEANLAIPFNKAALPGVTMTVGSPRGVPAGAQQVGQEGLIALIQSLFWGRDAAQTYGLLSEEKQRVAAGLVSSAAAAQDSLMQLSSFLSFESEGFLSSTWNSGMAGSDRLPVTIFVQPPSAVMAGGGGQRAGNNTLV